MFNQTEFTALVASAYQHLYDFVQLRTHPLAEYLLEATALPLKERGWRLHHLLLDVIEELSPGDNAPIHSREWRRHRIMVLRYVDALDPQQVADKLAISRRQFYREHAAAIEAIATILWNRCAEAALPDRAALLHEEMVRISQSESRSNVLEVVDGVLVLLQRILDDNQLTVERQLPLRLPAVRLGRNVLRQVMMGLLGYLVNHSHHAKLRFTSETNQDNLLLYIHLDPAETLPPLSHEDWFAALVDMLGLSQASITPLDSGETLGFVLTLPLDNARTVLVVDDNADMLALYERYLTPNGYQVLTAQHGAIALELARQARPFCAILDLMMPEQDGWELLQQFVSHPTTAPIPVIICSVLKQKELALALGATAFLEKPITEPALLLALAELKHADDNR